MAGQVVFGVQHVAWSELEHTSPLAQFAVQLTGWFVHGSVKLAQELAAQVFGVQQMFWSLPPAAPHCCPVPHVAEQVNVFPLQGSFQVPPQ